MKKPSYLIKTGAKEHMERLLHLGEVYMNTLSYFAKGMAGNVSKDDKNEGRWMDSGYVMIDDINNIFRAENLRHTGYIYCCTGFDDDIYHQNQSYRFRNQVDSHKFGEASVLIWNPKEFNNRLVAALAPLGLTLKHGWTKYDIKSEEQYKTGEWMYPFHKSPDNYRWQNEFRFYAPAACGDDPLKVYLGPIHDIACIMEKGMRYDLVHMHDDVYEVFSSVDQ